MAEESITLAQVLALARKLTPLEKVRLIEKVVPDLVAPLQTATDIPAPRGTLGDLVNSPLCGIWADRTDLPEGRRRDHG